MKEKGSLTLYIERNLSEDYCRDVPDLHIEGTLSAVYVILDKTQLELIKGLLDMNLGEGIEEFEKPSTVINDPIGPVSEGRCDDVMITSSDKWVFKLWTF